MKKLFVVVILLLIAGGIVLALMDRQSEDVERVPLAQYVPADVLMSLEVEKPYALWQRHPVRPFVEELEDIDWADEISAFLDPDKADDVQLAEESFKKVKGLLERVPKQDLFGDEIIAYTCSVGGNLSANLLTRLPDIEAERAWEDLLSVLKEVPQRYPWITGEVDDEGATLTFSQVPGRSMTLHCRRLADLVWFGNTLDEYEQLKKNLDPTIEKRSLADVEEYNNLKSASGLSDPDTVFYVSAERVKRSVEQLEQLKSLAQGLSSMDMLEENGAMGGPEGLLADPRVEMAAPFMGMVAPFVDKFVIEPAKARRGSMRLSRLDNGAIETSYVQSLDPTSEVAVNSASEMRDVEFMKYIPRDALGFSYKADNGMAKTYDTVMGIVNESPSGKQLLASVEAWEDEHGVNIEKDLIDWQTGELISVSLPSENSDMLTSGVGRKVWLLGARDEGKAEAALDRLADLIEGYGLAREEQDGVTVMGLGLLQMLPGVGGEIALTVRDGYAVIAQGVDSASAIHRVFSAEGGNALSSAKWNGMDSIFRDSALSYSFSDTAVKWRSVASMGQSLALINGLLPLYMPEPEQREKVTSILNLVQAITPAFEKLVPLDAEGTVTWYENGYLIERTRINVVPPEGEAEATIRTASNSGGGTGI